MTGFNTGKKIGQIQFDRWFDNTVFHKVENGRYVPNDFGLSVNINHSSGSAWLIFNADKLKEVKKILEDHGYKVAVHWKDDIKLKEAYMEDEH